jgi:coniferyl-aldehyde dehydrogenase
MSPSTASTATETPPTGDQIAIAQLHAAFDRQRRAFAADRQPTLEERRRRLDALIGMMLKHRTRIAAALHSDFGAHPGPASDLIEVLGVVSRARYVAEHLSEWMQPATRETDPALFGSAKAYVHYQPKGVIGNIVPWNFPFDLSVGPMIEMLAAGNRVTLKPSELTPACGQLLSEMIAEAFDPDLAYVAVGGQPLAEAFSQVAWNHLLYTGNPHVGRLVMAAAARNLTPVTLELGGKCPAVLLPGAVSARNIESIIGTKTVKNGQMCISVDYCLVPRQEVPAFVDLAVGFMQRAAPEYSRSSDCTGIISLRHLQRLEALLAEVKDRGTRIVPLEANGSIDRATRRMPMVLVIDPPRELRIMQEEIFGPILPIIPYDDAAQAVAMINDGERPLGLYVFGEDPAAVDDLLAATTSGGVTVNGCALQGALPSLGFGGTGMSGMGRHHGLEGFREFSNPRGIVVRGSGDLTDAFFAPYGKAAALIDAAFPPQ